MAASHHRPTFRVQSRDICLSQVPLYSCDLKELSWAWDSGSGLRLQALPWA